MASGSESRDSNEEDLTDILNRTLILLSSLLSLNYRPAWKVMQLACVTVWNISIRSIPGEDFLVKSGICSHLLGIIWRSELYFSSAIHSALAIRGQLH